jgi:phosphatidylinositol alpha-1,6-mannosyltransferase
MIESMNIVMLLTDAFGGFGGISKFNRDFILALDASDVTESVHVLPRLIPDPIREFIPESVVYDRKAAAGKIAFLRRVFSYVWLGPEPDIVICGHLNLLPAAWFFAKLRGARLALIVHGIDAWTPRNWFYNWNLRSVDSVIAVSRYTAERFITWSNISRDQVFILPNCVDLNLFKPEPRSIDLASRYGVLNNKVILTVGRLASKERYKGFDEVIAAMPELLRRFPTLVYMIVGDGDDRHRLEQKARSLGISEQVIFAGRITEVEKVSYHCLANAFVMPSYGEGFGIVFLEALACGIPVIGSKVDGSREALLEGQLGHLVDPKVPEELIAAVTDVLTSEHVRDRHSQLAFFDVAHFRSRVASWLEQQVSKADKQD